MGEGLRRRFGNGLWHIGVIALVGRQAVEKRTSHLIDNDPI